MSHILKYILKKEKYSSFESNWMHLMEFVEYHTIWCTILTHHECLCNKQTKIILKKISKIMKYNRVKRFGSLNCVS